MADETIRHTGDGQERLHYYIVYGQLLQCRGEEGTTTHRPLDGPGGAPRGRGDAEPQVRSE